MASNDRKAGEATASLATALREAIGREALSNAEVSRQSGVPYSTLRKILKGGQPIDYEEMRRLAPTLNLKVSALVARAEEIEADASGRVTSALDGASAAAPVPPSAEGIESTRRARAGVPAPRQRKTQRTGTKSPRHT